MVILLTPRQVQLLYRVIEEYVTTAEPVSSKTIASGGQFDVRSATIRNEMADLEDVGLLAQLHTSGGRVPTAKARTAGLRALAETNVVTQALTTLKGRARVKRTMWSRRAQEYEAKINSGDLISIAEVVRDLHRAENQPEQSYSERQLYESALDRMAREVAAIERIDRDAAINMLTKSLQKAA